MQVENNCPKFKYIDQPNCLKEKVVDITGVFRLLLCKLCLYSSYFCPLLFTRRKQSQLASLV